MMKVTLPGHRHDRRRLHPGFVDVVASPRAPLLAVPELLSVRQIGHGFGDVVFGHGVHGHCLGEPSQRFA